MDDWRISDCVNISVDAGTPVKACADGTVVDVKTDGMLGKEVIVQHNGGLQSVYANLTDQVAVKEGEEIEAGTVIGAVGQSAQSELSLVPHLHFEMMKNGQPIDPMVTIQSSSSSGPSSSNTNSSSSASQSTSSTTSSAPSSQSTPSK